jgi:hypothetical protein
VTRPAAYHFTGDNAIYRGDDESITVEVQDDLGAAVNITGRTYTAQIRKNTSLTAPVLAEFDCTITDAAGGIVVCSLDAATTSTLKATPLGLASSAVWDIQEDNGGVITTLLAGDVEIRGDVTRA